MTDATVTATAPPGGTAIATAIEPAEVTTIVEHTDPSPLPELSWLWRRIFVFVLVLLLCAHVGYLTHKLNDVRSLREIARNSQGLIALFALLYLAGANAEAIAKLVAAVRTSRKETATSGPPRGPDRRFNPPGPQPGASRPLPDRPGWER